MSAALPRPIQSYIYASNAHDLKSILDCFADDAVVRDENATRRGKIDIERWASETIDKYKFHFKPLNVDRRVHEREQRARTSLARFVATFLLPVELLTSHLLLLTFVHAR